MQRERYYLPHMSSCSVRPSTVSWLQNGQKQSKTQIPCHNYVTHSVIVVHLLHRKSMLHTRNHGINRGTNVCIVKEQPLTSAQAIRSDSPPLPIGDHSSHVTPGVSLSFEFNYAYTHHLHMYTSPPNSVK